MEEVLEVYQRPYDPLRPVVCIDETNKQLMKERTYPMWTEEPGKGRFRIYPEWGSGYLHDRRAACRQM